MAMLKSWEEGKAEARAEGQAVGQAVGQAKAVLTVLRARGITVPDAVRQRIQAETDLEQLERWLENASTASAIEDVIDDLG